MFQFPFNIDAHFEMYCALFNVLVLQVFKRYAVDGVVAIAIVIAIAENVRC